MLIKTELFDKFTVQITKLRRILRVNRILAVVKDLTALVKKPNKKRRDFFDIFFKLVMFFTDVNDSLLYLMQLDVLKERGVATLKKNVCNFYFF